MAEEGLLIVDAGSTKAEWVLVDGSVHQRRFTTGINPIIQTVEEVAEIMRLVSDLGPVSGVAYYGAGVSHSSYAAIITNALKEVWPESRQIATHHDLLGAARALWGRESGIAIILGTGANSCTYDGQAITGNVPALGYVIGDEGSGAYLGKRVLRDFCYGLLPAELREEFSATYRLTKDIIVENIYRKPSPNRWLAQYAKFLGERQDNEYVQAIVEESFREFAVTQVSQYPKGNVRAIGSIAMNFQAILKKVMADFGYPLDRVVQSPMEGLIAYHTSKE